MRSTYKILQVLALSMIISHSSFSLELTKRGTGDLGIVIERSHGSVLVISHTEKTILCKIKDLGDLSHASAVFSRDARYAFIFGRDGGLSKLDLLTCKTVKRIIQSGNSIGGAISQDGRLIAVSNYKPGGVNIFSSDDLSKLHTIPAEVKGKNKLSKTVGLVDAPGNRFIFSLFEGNSTWVIKLDQNNKLQIKKFNDIGLFPYDALITPDGRYYIAGLFGEDGLALLDTWHLEKGMNKILSGYGKGKTKLPVYKMPHLEGWAIANNYVFLPAIGQHKLLVVEKNSWRKKSDIALHSQPVFAMARPDGRQIWVNFAFPDNQIIQVINTDRLVVEHQFTAGKGVLHMEFTPRGEHIWISVRDKNEVHIYNTETFELLKKLPAKHPSGIFFTHRAHKIGL